MKRKYVFVILHYCVIDSTIRAIESIKKSFSGTYDDYGIVVVDNASPDKSGVELQTRYLLEKNITVLLHDKNEGFARGNNIGYQFSKENLKPDFMIIMNNDVLVNQSDFLKKIAEIYGREKFHILGPDILTPDDKHQNPHRMKNFTIKDLDRIIRNRTIILWYLKLKKKFRLSGRIQFIEKWDERRSAAEKSEVEWRKRAEGIVLQGSCMIFSSLYIEQEKEAFWPGTFMWMEEEILAFLCSTKGYKVVYSPEICVLHEGGKSTNQRGSEKYFFYSRLLRESAKKMRKLMREKQNV